MSKKLIVYDWNGTLINDTWVTAECFSLVIKPWGLSQLTEKAFRQAYDVPWTAMYKILGATDTQIAQLGGHSIGANFLDDYESRIDRAELHEGTVEILSNVKAKGIDQIILSNHIDDKIVRQLSRFGVESLFRKILAYESYSAEERKITKTDKLRTYIEENNLNPSNIIIIGDTPEEIRIANTLGLTSVSFTFGYSSEERLKKENPHYLVHSMKEFASVLEARLFRPKGEIDK